MLRWTSLLTNRLAKGKRRKRRAGSTFSRRLAAEPLEDRRMLATLTVNTDDDDTTSDDGFVTLREAIIAANNDSTTDLGHTGNGPDIINFASNLNGSAITLTLGELEITEALTIDASSLSSRITVDAKVGSRIFNVTAVTGNFTFNNLTLLQGRTTDDNDGGGALRSITSGELNINNTTITGSSTFGSSSSGGGVFATGTVQVNSSVISNNFTNGDLSRGGGIYVNGDLHVESSTITGNHTNSSFSGGGGALVFGELHMSNSTVSDNYTDSDYSPGGGLGLSGGTSIIEQSTISGNTTSGFLSHGGGIATYAKLAVHNSTIADNHVQDNDNNLGGGIWASFIIPEPITAAVATFVNGDDADLELNNTILATNTSLGGNPDLFLNSINSLSVHYSLIGNTSGLTVGQIAAIAAVPGNLTNVNPLLLPLDNNGGPTQTHYLMPLSPAINMGDPTVIQNPDEFDQRLASFLRVYGGRLDIGALEVIIDEEGPRVNDVRIPDHSKFDLFDPKPSEHGPTPQITQLIVDFIDYPVRDAVFTDSAVVTALAENIAHYSLVGDANGAIPIQSAQVIASSIAIGQPANATVLLTFFEPLPDDRYTFTVYDEITDPAGNSLDGESNPVQPVFPSGNGIPGTDFVIRFTVDTRAEIGVWAAGTVLIDTNGNFIYDPANVDATNRDLAYRIGYGSDYIFAGKFSIRQFKKKAEVENFNGGNYYYASGFDTIASYGRVGDQYRWLIDTDDNGVADLTVYEPVGAGINGYPVAGNFDGKSYNGDEVGLFTGTHWYFDTDHDFNVSDEDPVPVYDYNGFPIAGDFDGDIERDEVEVVTENVVQAFFDFDNDGDDDVATYLASNGGNIFYVDINEADPGDDIWIDGYADYSFRVGSPNAGGFGFAGSRERPVAADFNGDGIDDFGLWVPDGIVPVPNELSEWYLLLSGNDPFTPVFEYSVLDRIQDGPLEGFVPFSPEPFGNDLYAQFGNTFSLPIAGNFDPPPTLGAPAYVPQVSTTVPTSVPTSLPPSTSTPQTTTPVTTKVATSTEAPVETTVEVSVEQDEPKVVVVPKFVPEVVVVKEVVPETKAEALTPVSEEPEKTKERVEQVAKENAPPKTVVIVPVAAVKAEEPVVVPVKVIPVETEPAVEEVAAEQETKESAPIAAAADPPVVVAATIVSEATLPQEEKPVETAAVITEQPVRVYSRSRVHSLRYAGTQSGTPQQRDKEIQLVTTVIDTSLPMEIATSEEVAAASAVEVPVLSVVTTEAQIEEPIAKDVAPIDEAFATAAEKEINSKPVSISMEAVLAQVAAWESSVNRQDDFVFSGKRYRKYSGASWS